MFGRKRRGSSNPPLDRSNINPSAATAAASAFLANKTSSASLASAAAGAALRSRPTTPTSVADIQTKRTLRRHGSNSSMGSNVSGVSRPSLERKNSSGSMSERTFRDQSPGRGSIREASFDAPPVPAIPQNLKPDIPPRSHRRSNSLEAKPGRLASPPPNRANGRGSSMGPILGTRASPRRGQRMTSLSSVQELTGAERPARPGSVNFSYPTSSPRAMSPAGNMRLTSPSPSSNRRPLSLQPAQIMQNGTNLVYDRNTRSFRPKSEVYMDEELEEEEERPMRKKKIVQPKGTASGSQTANGTYFGGPKGTAVNAIHAAANQKEVVETAEPPAKPQIVATEPVHQSAIIAEPSSADPVPAETSLPPVTETKKKKKKRASIVSESGSEQGYTSNMSSDNDSDVPLKPRARPIGLQKRPSIVRELPEDEESDAEMTVKPQNSQNAIGTDSLDTTGVSPTPTPRINGAAKGRATASASAAYALDRQHVRSVSQPPLSPTEPNGSAASPAIGRGKGTIRGNRTVSVSPARTARFATEPEKPTTLTVMHHPPPRSISPRKSALKNSNSPRGPSPADEMPGSWNRKEQTSSEVSDNSAALEDPPRRKKKNARVSFDETHTVVGAAALSVPSEAATLPSPQSKGRGSWFGMKNKGKTTNLGDEEEDEFMKPRPVLPSFGSVRERKIREPTEERPLVIPSEAHHSSEAATSSSTLPNGNLITGVSNDYVAGSILARDAVSRNAANTSKLLEPLPPVVTSVEGSGYSSDSSAYDSAKERETQLASSENGIIENGSANMGTEAPQNLMSPDSDNLVFEDAENRDSPREIPEGEIPKIAVTRSTPTVEETEKQKEWMVPGGFPSGSSDSETHDSETQSEADTITPSVPTETPATVGIAEPPAESIHIASTGVAIENHAVSEAVEDSDHDSVYDDAAEDLSDGDGYLSLNAVASSPIKTLFPDLTPGLAVSTPPDSPVDRSIKERAFAIAKKQSIQDSEPDMGEGWDKAQQYWAGLTADKKREMEKAARNQAESSEEEDDEEEEEYVPVPPKPKAKKKVVVMPIPTELPSQPGHFTRSYQIPPGSKAVHNGQSISQPPLRSSMRATPSNNASDPTTHMRKSMRNGRSTQGSMGGSSESSAPSELKSALQKKNRPMSYPTPPAQPDPIAVQKHLRQISTPVNGKVKPTAVPQLKRSNSTDSESSFKRTRARSHSMRGSMRNSATQERSERTPRSYSPDGDKAQSSRFSIRSLSPTGSAFRRPFSGGPPVSLGQGTMRGTMRRSSGEQPRNSIISGFGKPAGKSPSKGRSRRFSDSSDEGDFRPAFRSRIVDSSDDDDEASAPLPGRAMRNGTLRSAPPQPLAPISKKKPPVLNDGDSSDLPDSDDEREVATNLSSSQIPSSTTAPTSLRRSGSGRGYSPASPALRDTQKQRTPFLSILRRKKDPISKVRKTEIESAARRDTPLERSRSELLDIRQNSSGLLQKRNAPTRTSSSSAVWPLRPASLARVEADDERPATADDAIGPVGAIGEDESVVDGGSRRPSLRGRRSTATGVLAVDIAAAAAAGGAKKSNVVLGRSGKPKRFMGLRRVLGIKD